jgi:hypothetical protein
MELIPILSFIILVATISTFILAVGAYVLYKIRERKGVTSQAPQPSAIPAELIAPAPLMTERLTGERRTHEASQQEYGYDYQRQPSYGQHEDPLRGPELRPTFVNTPASTYTESRYTESRYQKPTGEQQRNFNQDHISTKKKFMRYTNEGYVEPTPQEKKQEDNLRWR